MNNSKILSWCKTATVVASVLAMFTAAAAVSHAQDAKPLRIGTDDWDPYEVVVDGKQAGLASEVLVSVLDSIKASHEDIVTYPWSRGEKMLADGDLDVLYSASRSEKREQFSFLPAEPIIESKWVVFANKADGLKYGGLDDLKDKTVGVVNDYAYTAEFWTALKTTGKFEAATGDEPNFKKLGAKRVQFVACEYAVGMALAKKLGMQNDVVAFTDAPIKSTGLYYLFSKKTVTQDFVDKFSAALKQFKATPEYDKIYHKYL
jgi:polar amino acid transport system substrate-binding protein